MLCVCFSLAGGLELYRLVGWELFFFVHFYLLFPSLRIFLVFVLFAMRLDACDRE